MLKNKAKATKYPSKYYYVTLLQYQSVCLRYCSGSSFKSFVIQATKIAVLQLFLWAPHLSARDHASATEIPLGLQPRVSGS